MKLRKILMGLAAVVGFTTAATAATPVGVWDGFNSMTSGDYTWTASAGTTVEEGVVTIGSDGGLTIANPTGLGDKAVTFIADIEGFDPDGAQMTIFDIGLSSGNRVNDSNLSTTDKAVYQMYNAKNGYGNVGTISTGKVRIIMTYSAGSGTTTYVVGGNKADSGSLKESSSTIKSLGIGCYNGTERVAEGMKVYRLAMFNSKLSESEAKAYQFPSEAALVPMYSNRLSTGGENVPGGTYGAITVPGDGYKATAFTALTTLSNTASGEEITGSYANIIKSGTQIESHTVAGWFNVGELPTGDALKTIYLAKSCNNAQNGYKVVVNAEGKILVGKTDYDGGNYTWYGSPKSTVNAVLTEETAGNWFHLAVANARLTTDKVLTPTIYINGEVVEVESGTFTCNLNGQYCTDVMIGGGISAAGVYVDNNDIVYPSLVVEAATTYVAPYVEPTEYQYTVTYDMTWTEIKNWLGVSGDFPENAQITLNVPDDLYEPPIITFDTTETLTGGLAFIKILNDEGGEDPGTCNIALADSLYTDGCWSKTVFTAALIEAGNAEGVVKSGFNGGWTLGPTEIAIRAQNKEVISINIAGGDGNGDSPAANLVTNAAVYYGLAPTVGNSWNNINKQWKGGAKTIEIQSPLAYDGETTIQRPTMSLSATGQNTWQAGLTNPFLRGYLDDPGGVTVMVHGVPYTKYDVIVYATSDRTDTGIAPVTVNGTQYTMVDGETVEGDTAWGKGMCNVPAFGDNAMIIRDCEGEQLTISATRLGYTGAGAGRATLCAVQVINKGDVVLTTDYVGVMSGDVKWTDGAEDENLDSVGDPWVSGEYSTITITNIAEDATFTFTKETEGLKFKVVSEEGYALTIPATSMVEYGKLKTYDFTEAAGGVTIELPEDEAFDPSTLPLIEGGNWKFSKTGTLVFDGAFPTVTEQTFFTNDVEWTGTVWLKNVLINDNNKLAMCCNSNATLKVTGVKGYMPSTGGGGVLNQGVANLVLVDDGDTLALEIDDSSSGYVYVYDKFTGDGTFKFATRAKSSCAVVITDVSEFMGKLLSTAGLHHDGKTATTPRPIFVGGTEGTAGTTSLISVADGAAINPDCGWEAESVAFGATLMLMSGGDDATVVSGLTMEEPVYLATKVLYPEESNVGFSCLGYEDDAILIRKAAEFLIDPGENATVTTVLGAFEEDGNYYAANEAPVQVTFTAKEGYLFPNGSKTLTDDAEAGEGATIEPTDEPVQAEAKIGTTYYLTLAAALDAAQENDQIELIKDVAFTPNGKYTLDKTIYLTLGGFNLTGNGGTTFEVVNGASLFVTATDSIVSALRINVGRATNDNGSLFISGGTWTIDNNAIIHVNGTCKACTVTTQDADFTSNGDNAIQFCGAGTFSIDGGTITGATAVYVKAGTLSIAADLVANGPKTAYVYSANGANATGDALVIDNCGYPEGPAKVSLLAGTTLTSANAEKMGYYVYNSSPEGTVTKDATVDVNTPEGYLWKDGTTLTKAEAKIGDVYYLTLQDALNVGGDVVMLTNITKTVKVPVGKTVNLDFNGYEITTKSGQAIDNYGTLTIANGNITSKEAAIVLWGNSTTTISGGAYTAIDNGVIMGSGNDGEGNVTLTITGGTFNGGIESAGYIACGIYVPNSGTYTISGGQFNITGGCGICARAGQIKVASEAEFNLGGSTEPGWVGDSKRLVPCVAMFTDYEAAYPGHADTDYLKAKDNTLSTADTQTWVGPDGEGYYTLTVKTPGPTPAPGSDVEVDPVPGQDNTYYVNPTGEATALTIQGVKDGDTLIITNTTVTSLAVDNKTDVTITVKNKGGDADITDAVYGWDPVPVTAALKLSTSSANEGGTFSTVLDPKKVNLAVTGITPGATTEIAVTTDNGKGLTYTLIRQTEIGGEETPLTPVVATETATTLTDTAAPAGQAFYTVKATK